MPRTRKSSQPTQKEAVPESEDLRDVPQTEPAPESPSDTTGASGPSSEELPVEEAASDAAATESAAPPQAKPKAARPAETKRKRARKPKVWRIPINSEERLQWEARQKAQGFVPITLYTDGSCPENATKPGYAPTGAAAVLISGDKRLELAKPCGPGTNQKAELEALKLGLEQVKQRRYASVRVYSDSKYVIGCMTADWRLKTNVQLVAATRKLVEECSRVEFVHVDGHSGVEGNDLCDKMARHACDTGESIRRVVRPENGERAPSGSEGSQGSSEGASATPGAA